MPLYLTQAIPTSAVATGGTIAFGYPTGTSIGHFNSNTARPSLFVRGLQATFAWPTNFTISYGASTVTVTYNGSTTIPANSVCTLQLETSGQNDGRQMLDSAVVQNVRGVYRGTLAPVMHLKFGSPTTISTTFVLATTAVANANLVTLATASQFDVPRAVQIVSSDAADTAVTVTIRGFDEFNEAMTQTLTLNGTSAVLGTKAFSRVTSYQASGAMAGTLSIGNTKVLGLPLYLPGTGWVLRELQDGAAPTAGTVVAGVNTLASATTGDVRGTWAPNATLNGTLNFELVVLATDPTYRGIPQF